MAFIIVPFLYSGFRAIKLDLFKIKFLKKRNYHSERLRERFNWGKSIYMAAAIG
jgi:hypothetical protein